MYQPSFLRRVSIIHNVARSSASIPLPIRMLETTAVHSFLPWYAVENSVKEGRLIRLSVEDRVMFRLYRQIFSHSGKMAQHANG